MKKCKICGSEYEKDCFHKNGKTLKGAPSKRSCCKYCRSKILKIYRNANRIELNKKRNERRSRANPILKKWQSVYQSRQHYPGVLTCTELEEVWISSESKCEYCGKNLDIDKTDEWTFDHAQPLSKNGVHEKQNMRVTCTSCNSNKKAKTEEEFRGTPF